MSAAGVERARRAGPPVAAISSHWPEYAIEATLLGVFMLSACLFTVLLFHPVSPVPALVPDPFVRRLLMGLAMGGTAVCLNYSAWGKQSGAHYNPAVTLTFARLGRIAPRDAAAYVAAQFAGGVLGVLAATLVAGRLVTDASVRYAVTVPGPDGVAVAFVAEVTISFVLMTMVLAVSNHPRYGRLTGLGAGLLVATFITFEAPLSGMSMNPARTVGSAVWAGDWTALWIYFAAPLLGMLGAAQLRLWRRGREPEACAKLHHQNDRRCIFCEYRMAGNLPAAGRIIAAITRRASRTSSPLAKERKDETSDLGHRAGRTRGNRMVPVPARAAVREQEGERGAGHRAGRVGHRRGHRRSHRSCQAARRAVPFGGT